MPRAKSRPIVPNIGETTVRDDDDCLVCSLSAILDYPYESIPHFVRDFDIHWRQHLDSWLWHRLKLQMQSFDGWYPLDGLYMVDGVTHCGHSHMVVYRGRKLVYDSNPDGKGVQHIRRTHWLVPRDPSQIASIPK